MTYARFTPSARHQPGLYQPGLWTPKQCTQKKIQEKVYEKFVSIVRDAEYRKNNYATNLKLLDSCFWYPNDYCEALAASNQTPRLDFFKANGTFFHGRPPSGFVHVDDGSMPGGKRVSGYILKRGVVPADALRSVRESVCFFDCQEAIQLAYYDTLLEICGEWAFNRRFGFEGGAPLAFDLDMVKTPLASLLSEQLYQATDENFYRSIQKGDELFFKNIPLYTFKQPEGDAAAFHCMCSKTDGEKKFIAFGISEEGITEDLMLELFARLFNSPPKASSDFYSGEFLRKVIQKIQKAEAELTDAERERLSTMQITVDQIKAYRSQEPSEAGLQPLIRRLDAQRIKRLLK